MVLELLAEHAARSMRKKLLLYRVAQQIWHNNFVRLNFIKY